MIPPWRISGWREDWNWPVSRIAFGMWYVRAGVRMSSDATVSLKENMSYIPYRRQKLISAEDCWNKIPGGNAIQEKHTAIELSIDRLPCAGIGGTDLQLPGEWQKTAGNLT